MQFEYAGDEEGGRILSWFKMRLEALATCIDAGLPEASLTLIYSGIDTFGLLAASPGDLDATGDTYRHWCEKYILTRLRTIEGDPVTALDLWAARCGVLHTSTPLSKLEREGKAHQIWYQFLGQAGMNLIMNAKLKPFGLDIPKFALAFKEGGLAFLADLGLDPVALEIANARAQHFLRWGKVVH